MEQQDVRQPVGLTPAAAMRITDEARWIREREKAREIYLLEIIQQKRRREAEQEQKR